MTDADFDLRDFRCPEGRVIGEKKETTNHEGSVNNSKKLNYLFTDSLHLFFTIFSSCSSIFSLICFHFSGDAMQSP